MRIVVLGASGMLGHAVARVLASGPETAELTLVTRSSDVRPLFDELRGATSVTGIDVTSTDALLELFSMARPDAVINCVGLVKQRADADDPLIALPINALLPHRLAHLCGMCGARLVHVSTDCVFRGTRGGYTEDDVSDAADLYGRSKFLGEVAAPHAVTLRTSIIGHELGGRAQGLIGWFLGQEQGVRGFTRAIFSGLPTVELASVIRDHVLPRPGLSGLYQVAAAPISKFDLLTLVAREDGREIAIEPDDKVVIDRSLDGGRFCAATGYRAPDWPELVARMRRFG